jgi:AcrR family transcriptional regulator
MSTPAPRSHTPLTSSPAARGRPRSLRAKQAVLAATLDELVDVGLLRLSIESVAARAQVGKATIYRWWPDKVALVLEALRELPTMPEPETGSLREDLRALRVALVDLVATTSLGDVLPVLIAERRRSDHRDAIDDYIRERSTPFVRIVRRAMSRGELPRDLDADLVADQITGPLAMSILLRDEPLTDAQFSELVDLTLAGIGARQHPRPPLAAVTPTRS